jgi:hypothetical protein
VHFCACSAFFKSGSFAPCTGEHKYCCSAARGSSEKGCCKQPCGRAGNECIAN